jgi:hypothetical protein
MDSFFSAMGEELRQKIRLSQGLPAGKGHSAAGFIHENPIFIYGGHDFRYIHAAADDLDRQRGTGLCAFAAGRAPASVQDRDIGDLSQGCCFTSQEALRTVFEASARPDHEFRCQGLPFGIVAPEAVQRAAFEEDGRPDPRPVVDRIFPDIEDQPFGQVRGLIYSID